MKVVLWREIKVILKRFLSHTTIQGWKYIGNLSQNSKIEAFIWLMIYAIFSIFCFRDFSTFVVKYFQYEVASSVTYPKNDRFDFPSITMCNTNIFQRRLLALSPLFLETFARLDSMEKPQLNAKYCKAMNDSTRLPELDDFFSIYSKIGLQGLTKLVGISSNISVETCWFEGRRIDCREIVADQPIADRTGTCFTINPYVDNTTEHALSILAGSPSNSSTEKNQLKRLSAKGYGPSHALQVLMNADQNDYCGTYVDFSLQGAGFVSYMHDSYCIFKCNVKLSTWFHPGKAYNIAIKPTNVVRETESLGQCKSQWTSDNNKLSINGNTESICIFFCYAKQMWQTCKCIVKTGNLNATMNPFTDEGDTDPTVRYCGLDDVPCIGSVAQKYIVVERQRALCPDCMRPCKEVDFNYIITNTLFPSKDQMGSFNNAPLGIRKENVRKNYFYLNIYFDDAMVKTVVEFQKYTFIDMLNEGGNYISLFFGMSFLSVFDIPHFSIELITVVLVYIKNKHFKRQRIAIRVLKKVKKRRVSVFPENYVKKKTKGRPTKPRRKLP